MCFSINSYFHYMYQKREYLVIIPLDCMKRLLSISKCKKVTFSVNFIEVKNTTDLFSNLCIVTNTTKASYITRKADTAIATETYIFSILSYNLLTINN